MYQIKAITLTFFLLTVATAIDFKFKLFADEVLCFGDQIPENMLIYGKVTSSSKFFKFEIYVMHLLIIFKQVENDQ